jgi:hypothetical protein
MTKRNKGLSRPYLIERRFRCVDDSKIGMIQHLWLDERWTQAALARKFKVSTTTIGAVCRAIPARFLVPKPAATKLRKARTLRLVTDAA